MMNKGSNKVVKVFILSGEGINCEEEMKRAFYLEGAQCDIINFSLWKKNPKLLLEYDIFAIPGGFSYADELGAGHVLSCELILLFEEIIDTFINQKKGLVIGVCNGFQVLIRLGLFDVFSRDRKLALAENENNQFINTWALCKVNPHSICHWTKGIKKFVLPIRHAEGQIFINGDEVQRKNYFKLLESMGQIVLQYDANINGSYQNIAGLTDRTGQVFGLMPHPEAAIDEILYPENCEWSYDFAKKIFTNAIEYCLRRKFNSVLNFAKNLKNNNINNEFDYESHH